MVFTGVGDVVVGFVLHLNTLQLIATKFNNDELQLISPWINSGALRCFW
jgi:hypothetical protein